MAERKLVSSTKSVNPKKAGMTKPAGTRTVYVGTVDADWTCNSCGHDHINGSTKLCPMCGNPKDSTETYVTPADSRPFLTEKDMKARGVDLDHGSDEECPFCNAKIAPKSKICPNCGGAIKMSGKQIDCV